MGPLTRRLKVILCIQIWLDEEGWNYGELYKIKILEFILYVGFDI